MKSNLQDISDNNFGIKGKGFSYSRAWFMRSLVPSLYNTSLDAIGFPRSLLSLTGNFPPQSLHPLSRKYPLFIVDHPV
ncbi:hypothetical protein PILCRDRAFT_533441 [Piloderma croceum F 1598]|uniref:Uncharacterized protein n=1 Tax=Piloderma croceum (strain F 1598) TaxID=765440 RepID=A0A0C3F2Z4_PILCF|nr:hypothetical protein PILCRDRAFT_706336 [Piloderma croceum F 1598]KIM80469.1 hypothetical protein PILCRDRAFT_533441 [Piloderma croceum F 1598]